jgi:hypothetical protein
MEGRAAEGSPKSPRGTGAQGVVKKIKEEPQDNVEEVHEIKKT